jgi:hypothetical protein
LFVGECSWNSWNRSKKGFFQVKERDKKILALRLFEWKEKSYSLSFQEKLIMGFYKIILAAANPLAGE